MKRFWHGERADRRSGLQLKRALERFGFSKEHQSGSHLKLVKQDGARRCVAIVPMHNPIPPGTLRSILQDIADFHAMKLPELIKKLKL